MQVNPIDHTWNEDGDRCTRCGNKDWFAGPYCNAVHVYGYRLEDRAFIATPAGAELLMLAAEELKGKERWMFVDKEDCERSIRKTLNLYSDKTEECIDILSDLMLNQIDEARANERLTCMDLFGEVVWQRERLINLLPKAWRKELFAALSKLVEDYFSACQVDRSKEDTRWKIKYLVLSENHQRYKYNAKMALRRVLKIHESVPVLLDEYD